MRPEVDLALDGRYWLVRRIAVGGMGEVWVAHDKALARDIAVKVLREEFAGDPGFIERFRTEARNSAQLSHPNIAQLYDYGEQEGSAYLVMELIDGEPMSELLKREYTLTLPRLLPLLAQTARGLHAAHVAGVVHRDIKPGNILITPQNLVKITDFGISLAGGQIPMTATGMVMGTAQYLSPEQALGRPATPASDIYSLGIIAYEAVVGHRPFTGGTAVDIAVAHVNKTVPPLPASVPPDFAALVMRMLSKDPERRPRSAASLARTMDAMLTGGSAEDQLTGQAAIIHAPPPSYPPTRQRQAPSAPQATARRRRRDGRRGGRRTGRTVLAVLLLIVFTTLGAVIAYRIHDDGAADTGLSGAMPDQAVHNGMMLTGSGAAGPRDGQHETTKDG